MVVKFIPSIALNLLKISGKVLSPELKKVSILGILGLRLVSTASEAKVLHFRTSILCFVFKCLVMVLVVEPGVFNKILQILHLLVAALEKNQNNPKPQIF